MNDIPLRMYFSEVEALAKVSKSTLRMRIKIGDFPSPVDRGKELIFSGYDVYKALGLQTSQSAEERLIQALNG